MRPVALFLLMTTGGSAMAADDCPTMPAPALLSLVEESILEGRLDETAELTATFDAALGCAGAADPALVARALAVDGLWRHFRGEADGAALAFASAHALDPGAWNPDYGADAQAAWERAIAAAPAGAGTLAVEPALHPDLRPLIDGAPVTLPASVPVGFHLVQVVESDGRARYASRALLLDPGEHVVVNTGPLAPLPPGPAPTAHKPTWPLWTAGGLAALGGGAALWASSTSSALEQAGTVDDLNTAYRRQKVLAASAYTLSGLAAASLGVWVVW
jgi:hypothetical protein